MHRDSYLWLFLVQEVIQTIYVMLALEFIPESEDMVSFGAMKS